MRKKETAVHIMNKYILFAYIDCVKSNNGIAYAIFAYAIFAFDGTFLYD